MSKIEGTDRGLDLSFATSVFATAAVAVAPSFVAFGFLVWSRPDGHPVLATVASILLTFSAFVMGAKVWERQPESSGYSFADLMLWHWMRREWAEEKLVRNARLLGYDRNGRFVGKSKISAERQLQAAREIGSALDAKSSYTINHAKRVESHVRDMAAVLGLSAPEVEELATAAALHDIGNLRVPEHVARKTIQLTLEERSTIEGHVLLGAIMAFDAVGDGVVQGLRHHHERWDGDGYPSGLKGEEIPLYARIIGIAEAYDAMTSTRPYRQSLTQDQAVAVLRKEAGEHFDVRLVETFVSTLPEPLEIIERLPFLAWAQRQIRELSILFRRVGAVALSAAASTIAIALILGTAMLKPDAFGGGTDGPVVRPHERIASGNPGAGSLGQHATVLAATIERSSLDGFVQAPAVTGVDRSSAMDVRILGETIDVDLFHGGDGVSNAAPGGSNDPGTGRDRGHGGGSNDDNDGDGTVRPDPIIVVQDPQDGGGGSGGVGGGVGGGGGTGGGTTNPPDEPDPTFVKKNGKAHPKGSPPGHSKNKGPKGGGGNSGNTPGSDHPRGQDKWGTGGPGKSSGNGNGKDKSSGTDTGSGTDKSTGNSGSAPGHSDDKGKDKVNSGSSSDSGSSSTSGSSSSDSGSSDSGSDAPGNSGSAPGHSDDKSKDKDAGNTGGSSGDSGASSSSGSSSSGSGSDAPGKSENAPGHSDDKGKDKDKATEGGPSSDA